MTESVDQASKLIHASPEMIYRAIASAGAMESWLPPKGAGQMLAFAFREGGTYRMRLSHREPHLISGAMKTTWTFDKARPEPHVAFRCENGPAGRASTLENLARYVE